MVISPSEKAVLLERLQKARETKAAKAAAAKAAKHAPAGAPTPLEKVKEPEPPAPAPAPVAAPPPEPVLEKTLASEPIDIPQVPDLVAMSKKKHAKKKCPPISSDEDSDEEAELPPRKGKKQAYMKIKIYKEPKNAAAFQSLVEAIQDEEPEPEPAVQPPHSASIGRGCKFDIKNKTPAQSRTLSTPQELMRRAALEFFS